MIVGEQDGPDCGCIMGERMGQGKGCFNSQPRHFGTCSLVLENGQFKSARANTWHGLGKTQVSSLTGARGALLQSRSSSPFCPFWWGSLSLSLTSPCDSTSLQQGDAPLGPSPWPAIGWTDVYGCFVSSSLVRHHVNYQAPPRGGGLRRRPGWVQSHPARYHPPEVLRPDSPASVHP